MNQREMDFILRFKSEADAVLRQTSEGFEKAAKSADKFERELRDTNTQSQKMKVNMGEVAGAVAGAASAFAAFSVGVTTFREFELGLANVQTLLPEMPGITRQFGDEILRISRETGTPFQDLTEGLYQTVSAFGDAESAIGQLMVANKAAVAGIATTGDAVNLLSAVTKGYGDTSSEAVAKVSDLAFTTVKLGQTTFPELASSIGRVVPIANEMGIAVEELFGGFATLTGVTGNTAEVSTQLSAAMTSILKPTDQMNQLLDKVGVTSGKALIKQYGMLEGFRLLDKASRDLGISLIEATGRKEGFIAMTALAGSQLDVARGKFSAMDDAVGATDAAFATIAVTLDKALLRIGASIDTFQIAIGKTMAPAIHQFADGLDTITDMFSRLEEDTQGLVASFSVLAGGLLATARILGRLIPGIGGLIAKFAGLGAGALGVKIATEELEEEFGGFGKLLGSVERATDNVIDSFTAATGISLEWADIMDFLSKSWEVFMQDLDNAGTELEALSASFGVLIERIGSIISYGITIFKEQWTEFLDWFPAWFDAVDDQFTNWMTGLVGMFPETTSAIKEHWNTLSGEVSEIWDSWQPLFQKSLEWLGVTSETQNDLMKADWRVTWDDIGGFATSIIAGIVASFLSIPMGLKAVLMDTVTLFEEFGAWTISAGRKVGEGAALALKGEFSAAKDALVGIGDIEFDPDNQIGNALAGAAVDFTERYEGFQSIFRDAARDTASAYETEFEEVSTRKRRLALTRALMDYEDFKVEVSKVQPVAPGGSADDDGGGGTKTKPDKDAIKRAEARAKLIADMEQSLLKIDKFLNDRNRLVLDRDRELAESRGITGAEIIGFNVSEIESDFSVASATLQEQFGKLLKDIDKQIADAGKLGLSPERILGLSQLSDVLAEQRDRELDQLALLRDANLEYATSAEAVAAAQREAADAARERFEDENRFTGDFFDGITAGWRETMETQATEMERGKAFILGAYQDMQSAIGGLFSDLTTGQINDFGDLVGSIQKGLAGILQSWADYFGQLAAQYFADFILRQILGIAGFGSVGSFANPIAGPVTSGAGGGTPFAKGGAFSNGIVTEPTSFNMGLMGENGAEAIMPLHRGPDGTLGVRSLGGAGGGINLNYNPTLNFSVDGAGSEGGSPSAEQGQRFLATLDNKMRLTALEVIQEESRPGGTLYGQQEVS